MLKKRTTVKILSIILSACMLLTAAPLAGFVGLKLPDFSFPISASAEEVASGTCGIDGDNLTWTLDDAGLLTIEGTGAMPEWTTYSDVPWYSSRSLIKQVKIGSGVTSIGENAFHWHYAMTKADFSGGIALSSIGKSAFTFCLNLTEVTLPDSPALTSIGQYAFDGSSALTTIDLSNCTLLTSIGIGAFRDCAALTTIDLSASTELLSIGFSAFLDCKALTMIDLSACSKLNAINNSTFSECVSLTEIDLSACTELTAIKGNAFRKCTALTRVDLSTCNKLSEIGPSAFMDCSSLPGIDLSGCIALNIISSLSFIRCTALTEIDLSACTALSSIGGEAFRDCTALAAIKIGNPECEIYDEADTIDSGATIYGYPGSTAEAYATLYGRDFAVLVPHTHTPGEWVVDTAATCTAAGSRSRSCTGCLALLETENIAALGHAVVDDAAVASTCTATGLTAGAHCSACGEVFTAQTVVAALGHTDGNADGYCDRCGATIGTEEPQPELNCFERIAAFFRKIIDFFKNLFR